MSITGFKPGSIKAAIEATKQQASAAVSGAMNALAVAHNKATVEVPHAIHQFAAKVQKEADDALQELAEYDNGAPPLDDHTTELPKVELNAAGVIPEKN